MWGVIWTPHAPHLKIKYLVLKPVTANAFRWLVCQGTVV
jgi:hypothetical protein